MGFTMTVQKKQKQKNLNTHSAFGLISKGACFYVQDDPVL